MMLELLLWFFVLLIVYTYFIYPLVLCILSVILPAKKRYRSEEYSPTISLVIAAYNEEESIRKKIINSLALEYPKEKMEIVIVSDGSTDRTNEIIGEFASKNRNLVLIKLKENKGKANALNKAVRRCNGEIIVFSDATTIYKKDALKKLVPYFSDSQVGLVSGRLDFIDKAGKTAEGLYWRYETWLRRLESKTDSMVYVSGAIYAIRRKVYRKLPENTINEDLQIPFQISSRGYRSLYADDAVAYEEVGENTFHEFVRRVRIGAGNYQALFRVINLNPIKGVLSFNFFSHKVLRWLVPFFLIIIAALNIALINERFYLFILIVQLFFYIFAFVGFLLDLLNKPAYILKIPYFFAAMNLAMLVGFFRFIKGIKKGAWTNRLNKS